MAQVDSDLHKSFDSISQMRDELMLQMNLMQKETRDQWDRLEDRWNDLKGKMDPVSRAAADTASGVAAAGMSAARDILGELAAGYDRIRKAL